MAEEMTTNKGGFGWPLGNTLAILATLGASLGISIPALVKANDAQDDEHHRHHRFDPNTGQAVLSRQRCSGGQGGSILQNDELLTLPLFTFKNPQDLLY